MLKKLVIRLWSGFSWPKIVSSGSSCKYGNKPLGSIIDEEFHDRQNNFELVKMDCAP
jgi:hypothetical protein